MFSRRRDIAGFHGAPSPRAELHVFERLGLGYKFPPSGQRFTTPQVRLAHERIGKLSLPGGAGAVHTLGVLAIVQQELLKVCKPPALAEAKKKIQILDPLKFLAITADGLHRVAAHHDRWMNDRPADAVEQLGVDFFVIELMLGTKQFQAAGIDADDARAEGED